MNEQETETVFLGHLMLYDDSGESRKLEKTIGEVQHDARCVQRFVSAMALLSLLATVGVAYGAVLQEDLATNQSQLVLRFSCALLLASLTCLVTFAGLFTAYSRRLKRLRGECRQLVARVLESRLGKPHRTPLRVSRSGSDDREAFQEARPVSA